MSAKFTKGPWHAIAPMRNSWTDHGYRRVAELTREPSIWICAEAKNMLVSGHGYVWGDREADAALIAASPELFDAVDMLVKSFNAAGIAADCDSNNPAEVLMCKAMRAWLKTGMA